MRIRLLTITVLAMSVAGAVFADVTGINFSNDAQVIDPDVISGKITVSASEKIPETGDLYLTSSSATGEFSSSNTNWKAVTQVTMSKNTGSRSFYYKDTSVGNFTLTARLVLRTSLAEWSASQEIAVGVPSNSKDTTDEDDDNPPAETDPTPEADVDDNTNNEEISAHDSPLPTSGEVKIKMQLVAEAGRRRIGVTHSPVTFSPAVFDQSGTAVSSFDTVWSFGDGTTAHGETVQHTYLYPGDYVVIMNVQKNDLTAVDRTIVHITLPEISIARVQTGVLNSEIEVANKSNAEVNLARWSLSTVSQAYVFPADTILLAGKSIVLPYDVTKMTITERDSISVLTPNRKTQMVYIVMPAKESAEEIVNTQLLARTETTAGDCQEATTTLSLSAMRTTLVALSRQIVPLVTAPYVADTRMTPETFAEEEQKIALVLAPAVRNISPPPSSSKIFTVNKPKGLLANFMSLFSK